MEEVIASSQTNIVEESPAPVETISRVIKTVSFKKQHNNQKLLQLCCGGSTS